MISPDDKCRDAWKGNLSLLRWLASAGCLKVFPPLPWQFNKLYCLSPLLRERGLSPSTFGEGFREGWKLKILLQQKGFNSPPNVGGVPRSWEGVYSVYTTPALYATPPILGGEFNPRKWVYELLPEGLRHKNIFPFHGAFGDAPFKVFQLEFLGGKLVKGV